MSLPFFYEQNIPQPTAHFTLSEETSKHCIQVLRMKTGSPLQLTDGKGNLFKASIAGEDKRKAVALIESVTTIDLAKKKICIAISLLKNASRFEWFLEKATEMGITEIQPLLCDHTENERFRSDRMQGILVSAMLQSQQAWLPVLHEPIDVKKSVAQSSAKQKLIAHCEDGQKQSISTLPQSDDTLLLIGPEGDFSHGGIVLAQNNGFLPVSLGETRLRTETAGVVASALLIYR